MKTSKNYIIGGGVAGLIWSFYNPDFAIISPELEGGFKDGVFSVSWIHDTEDTRQFLRDLKLFVDPYLIKIGYYYNGYVHDYCMDEYKKAIILKKMTDVNTNKLPKNFKMPSLNLSVENNILNGLHTDLNVIYSKIASQSKWIKAKIIEITLDHVKLDNGKKLVYNKLVSTIPAPIFWKLYRPVQVRNFDYIPITIAETWDKPLIFNDQYQMTYIAEDYTFSRIVKKEPHAYAYEFTGRIDNIKKFLPNVRINKIATQQIGRLIAKQNKSPSNKIIFCGRFAEWDNLIKVQDNIKQAITYQKYAQS